MTPNEVKLIKWYCLSELGRPWHEVLEEWCQKRLQNAKDKAISKRAKPSLESLLADVESLPDDIDEKPILIETT